MASELSRRVARALLRVWFVLLAIAWLTPGPAVYAESPAPWWVPVGLRGMAVTTVRAQGATVIARTATGATWLSNDSARTFARVPGDPQVTSPPSVRSGDDTWLINSSGAVLHSRGSGPLRPDPAAPGLGGGARLVAAPAALPGVVVAVAVDGTVYRRSDGHWARALLLLPESLVHGVPQVTSVVAFTQPVTDTVYVSTDGYAVLLSTDGGDDWIRAGPGLPDSVHALAADDSTRTLYAGASDGLYAHRLQALPAPPAYRDAALVYRWLGTGLVSLLSAIAAGVILRRVIRPVAT